MTTPWRAGAARAALPIPIGTPMAGYAARIGPAIGTLDDLEIAAVVLAHGEESLVLVTIDLIAVDPTLVPSIAAAAGIAPSLLLLAASHTHSGPAGIVARLHPAHAEPIDHPLRERLIATVAETIRAALSRLQPASVLLGRADVPGVGANRNDPNVPSDPRVTTLAITPAFPIAAAPIALVIHVPCHPTVLGAENCMISADLPGGLRRALRARPGGGDQVVLIANGASGDISTRFTRQEQTPAEVDRLGALLADGVAHALATALPLDGPIRRATTDVPLPRKPDPGPDATAIARRLRAEADRVLASDLGPAEKRRAFTRAQGAELAAGLAGASGIPATAPLSAWTLGDLALVTIPGELFASLGQAIEHGSSFPSTIVIGYANGHVGYLVDPTAATAATYEALASPYTPAAGAAVVRAAVALLNDLHASLLNAQRENDCAAR